MPRTKGSKDTKPRQRRTKKEMEESRKNNQLELNLPKTGQDIVNEPMHISSSFDKQECCGNCLQDINRKDMCGSGLFSF